MKNPSIENLIKHNESIMKQSLEGSIYDTHSKQVYYRCKGWVQALNYITNNYNLEEK